MNFKRVFASLICKKLNLKQNIILNLIEVPPNPNMGDLAFPCFMPAKKLKKNPNQIAIDLSKNLSSKYFSSFETQGPYLNAVINKSSLLKSIFRKEKTPSKKLKKVAVEYMNANPNKALHIGQARNICIGDTLVRTFRFLGFKTHAINYGDDSGVNVGLNLIGHLYCKIPFKTKKKFDHYCGEIYSEMRKEDYDSKFKKQLSSLLLNLEEGKDKRLKKIHKEYTRKCAIAQFETCWKLNSFFNLVNWETDILHLNFLKETMDKLKKTGLVKFVDGGDAAGCWVIDLSGMKCFEGLKTPYQVLIKSDGVATYCAKDIAYALWKLGFLKNDFYYDLLIKQPNGECLYTTSSDKSETIKKEFGNYNLAINVIDNRQTFSQRIVKTSLSALGYLKKDREYIHLPYGVVYLKPKTLIDFGFKLDAKEKKETRLPFSSRKGWSVTIDETLEILKKKAYKETKKRNPKQKEAWLNHVSEKIALAALRFFLTKFSSEKDIVFDIDEVLDMQGETGVYSLYTYARISNILKKSSLSSKEFNANLLTENLEVQIAKQISELQDVAEETCKKLSPELICKYILQLCQTFNSYYSSVPVLNSPDEVKKSRLNLLKKLQETLKVAMNLIGIKEMTMM